MEPTRADFTFWQAKQKTPSWAESFSEAQGHAPDIDACINSHAKLKHSKSELEANNLLSILRVRRARGDDLVSCLRDVSCEPACTDSPRRRRAFACKWANRMLGW